MFIIIKADASIKHIIVTFPDNDNLAFTLGIPFAGVHMESSDNETDYADYVEIWRDEYGTYLIAIRGLGDYYNNNKFTWYSEIKKSYNILYLMSLTLLLKELNLIPEAILRNFYMAFRYQECI